MKILMPKWAKVILVIIVFAAAVGLGLFLESLRNDVFYVERISVNDSSLQTTAAPPEEAVDQDGSIKNIDSYNVSSDMVKDGKININTASKELLMEIDGVGESLASRIIEYRTQNGPFESIEEIMNVSGIGQKKLEDMRDMICVE